MPNIFDIARLAGISKTTVSKVLNNQYGVSEKTREKVLAAVKELNYIPNQAARRLVTSKSGVIGVIYDSFNQPVYMELASYLEKYASESGYNLVFCNSNDNFDTKTRYVNYLVSGASDGIVFFGSDTRDRELIIKLKDMGFPFLVIENHFENLEINNIIIDNIAAAQKAMNYLFGLNHQKIAHITGNIGHRAASDRLNGYIRALQEHGLPFTPDYIVYTNGKQGSAQNAVKGLLELKDKPTAILAFNDILAYECADVLSQKGYKIPEDFSVIGFDNIAGSMSFLPGNLRMTSMSQPLSEVAQASISVLLAAIHDRDAAIKSEVFQMNLAEGESCKSKG